jgi:hypothetical protein
LPAWEAVTVQSPVPITRTLPSTIEQAPSAE